MDALSYHSLGRLISLGSSSLLQYVCDSAPFSPVGSDAALPLVLKLAQEERDQITLLIRWMQKKHERLPATGVYPSHFTTTNFCSIEYLLPKVIAETTREITELERLSGQVDDNEVHVLVVKFLEMKRRHLAALTALTKPAAV